MNQYGRLASSHWQRWLPTRHAELPDPAKFFTTLGDEVEQEIEELAIDLAGNDPPGETFLQKLGRLRMSRQQAEEQVLRERVLLTPEPTADPDEEPTPPPAGDWTPVVEDPTTPYWRGLAH